MQIKGVFLLFFLVMGLNSFAVANEQEPESQAYSEEPNVHFVMPKNGDTVETTFYVKMATSALKVEPAGAVKPDSGHHHIMIDAQGIPKGQTVPKDAQHKHFGKGQVETKLTLTPGEHTLTLQFADGAHQSYGSHLRHTIKITVK